MYPLGSSGVCVLRVGCVSALVVGARLCVCCACVVRLCACVSCVRVRGWSAPARRLGGRGAHKPYIPPHPLGVQVSTVGRKREGAVSRELRILRHRLASESPLHWNKPAIQTLIDDIVRVHPSLA